MMKETLADKAFLLRVQGGIQRDEQGNFLVPSSSSSTIHIVSVDGLCSCPAMKLCRHAIAAFGAHVPLIQFNWAGDYEELMLIAEVHKESIKAMPARVRDYCRQEFIKAKERLKQHQQQAA
jgi:hypothetical protein